MYITHRYGVPFQLSRDVVLTLLDLRDAVWATSFEVDDGQRTVTLEQLCWTPQNRSVCPEQSVLDYWHYDRAAITAEDDIGRSVYCHQ